MCKQFTNYKLEGMICELQCSLLHDCKLLLTCATVMFGFWNKPLQFPILQAIVVLASGQPFLVTNLHLPC